MYASNLLLYHKYALITTINKQEIANNMQETCMILAINMHNPCKIHAGLL